VRAGVGAPVSTRDESRKREALVQRARARLGRGLLLARKALTQQLAPCENAARRRVFVAGMQRSGTNMLMDVLEQSMETDVYHERDPRAFADYQMRDRAVIQGLIDRSKACIFVIKALCELQDLGALMERFAPARTVWIYRDYNDVVNSMMRSFEGMADQVRNIAGDRNSSSWRGRGMSDDTHRLVRGIAGPLLTDASASALQWYFRNILFFEQGFDTDPRVMLVRYESLVTQPQEEFARIFRFLGADYTPRVSRQVSAGSIGKHEQPAIDPSITAVCDELFARFNNLLQHQRDAAHGEAVSSGGECGSTRLTDGV